MKKEKNPTLTVSNIARLLYCEQQVFFEKKYKKASKSKRVQEGIISHKKHLKKL